MEVIRETLETPVSGDYDVLVAGGGVAGIAAALAAARNGKKVCLLEKQFMLGGLATAGLITIYLPICDGMGTQVSYGLAEELLHASIKYGYEARYPQAWMKEAVTKEDQEARKKHRYEVQFNAQLFAITAEELLLKEGVTILYGTSACAVTKENQKITAVIIENKSGRSALKVKSVVDATGDADICLFAGEETACYRTGNSLAAWYYYADEKGYYLRPVGYAELPDELKTEEQKKQKSTVFGGLDAEEISDMMALSHKRLLQDVLQQRKDNPQVMPVTMATIPQLRMTRRIVGEYTMELSDDRAHFSDSIGMVSNWRKRGPVYEVPFRCLHGSQVKNLITAGRIISADDPMWDITRVIPVCALTGEAAGTAAAMSEDFTAINIEQLQMQLKKQGVRLFCHELDEK